MTEQSTQENTDKNLNLQLKQIGHEVGEIKAFPSRGLNPPSPKPPPPDRPDPPAPYPQMPPSNPPFPEPPPRPPRPSSSCC